MVTPSVGAVILIPFPFSDLSNTKLRPALIIAAAGKGDWICVQITSNPYADDQAITLNTDDFATGSLERVSYARPGKLFTANQILFKRIVGTLQPAKTTEIQHAVTHLIQHHPS